jgi:hypothetical protein
MAWKSLAKSARMGGASKLFANKMHGIHQQLYSREVLAFESLIDT